MEAGNWDSDEPEHPRAWRSEACERKVTTLSVARELDNK